MSTSISTSLNLSAIEKQLSRVIESNRRIESELSDNTQKIQRISANVRELTNELNSLSAAFNRFINDSQRAASLQKAATELIRVRQELEQNYGGYKIVRETMLGVLQATDLALVKKTTISQVTEELMLSTPDYWLAPCLVAIAAWIGNDRDLSNRAIREAVKRDEEKTALAMALICRRNNRTDTCFEWLSVYFAKQSAENFTESNFTYLNAYLSGVFGPDKKHMCEDYVTKWLREIQSNGIDFEQKQTEIWKNYCKNFTVDLDGQFPLLNCNVKEYNEIAEYVSRINAVSRISGKFSSIKNLAIEEEKLKKDIDQTLVELISRCDSKEEPLRKEEKYLQAIRYFNGDTEAAKRAVLESDRKRTEDTIDLVGQMTNIIINREDARPSERRTSVNFLSGYIRNGFEKFITEKKEHFPKQITFQVDSWTGKTTDGSNAEALHRGYTMRMQKELSEKIDELMATAPNEPFKVPLALIILFFIPFGMIYLLFASSAKKSRGRVFTQIEALKVEYNKKILAGHRQIDNIINEWKKAKTIVTDFESRDLPDIVA